MDRRKNDFYHSRESFVPVSEQSKAKFKNSRNRRSRKYVTKYSPKNIGWCPNHIYQPSMQPMGYCTCQPPVKNSFCHPNQQPFNSFYQPPQQSFQHSTPIIYANREYFYTSGPPHLNQVPLNPAVPCPCHGIHQRNMHQTMNNKRRRYFYNKRNKMAKMNKQKNKNRAGNITQSRKNQQQEAENTYFSDHYTSEDDMQPTTLEEIHSETAETHKNHTSNEVENAIYIKISDNEYQDEFLVPESNLICQLFHTPTLTFELHEKSQVMQFRHSAKAMAYLLRLVIGEENPELNLNMETEIESYSIATECNHEALKEKLKKSIENDVLGDDIQMACDSSNEFNFYEAVAKYKLSNSDFGAMKQCSVTCNEVLQLNQETAPSFHDFVKHSKLPCEFNIESKHLMRLHGIVLRCRINKKRGDRLKIICSIRIGTEDYLPIFDSKDVSSHIFVQFKNSILIEPGEKATVCITIEGEKHDMQQEFQYSDKNLSFTMKHLNTENMDEKVFLEKILYHFE